MATAPPPEPTNGTDPTLALVLARMMERDDTQRDAWAHLTGRVSDQNSVLQGLQGEVSRLVKLAERQDEYNQRQIVLQEQTSSHAATFERAFSDIKEITRNLDSVSKTVTAYGGSVAMLKMMASGVLVVGMAIVGFGYNTLAEKIAEARIASAREVSQLEAKIEGNEGDIRELQQARAQKP